MATTSPPYSPETLRRRDAAPSESIRPVPAWQQYLPCHRIYAVAKTPVLVALGMYLAGGHFAWRTVGATLALTGLLWALLYALNEAFDLAAEDGWHVPRVTTGGLMLAVVATCGAAGLVSTRLALLFSVMTALQLAYCAPPARLKRWWWPIVVIGGVCNPLLRIECGALWGAAAIPPLALAVPILMHLGATFRTRALQRDRDRRHGYRVAPPGIEAAGSLCTVLSIFGAAYLCVVGIFPRLFVILGPPVVAFGIYAWSAKATSMARLRKAWALFAFAAIFVLAVLLAGR